jgi:hypothetical protein
MTSLKVTFLKSVPYGCAVLDALHLAKIKLKVNCGLLQSSNYNSEYVVNNPFSGKIFWGIENLKRAAYNPENTLESFLCHVHFGGFLPLHSLANASWTWKKTDQFQQIWFY